MLVQVRPLVKIQNLSNYFRIHINRLVKKMVMADQFKGHMSSSAKVLYSDIYSKIIYIPGKCTKFYNL